MNTTACRIATPRGVFRAFAALLLCLPVVACGGDEAEGGSEAVVNPQGTNRARFVYEVDLHGVRGELTVDLEVVGTAGITWGPGSRPDISGVIGTGESTIYTAGELRSPNAHYTFTGQNAFADFTDRSSHERFRVQWHLTPQGLRMVANPFGPSPAVYDCVLRSSRAL